jgi:hypothetical protein
MRQRKEKSVLFLCTGNFYPPRFSAAKLRGLLGTDKGSQSCLILPFGIERV